MVEAILQEAAKEIDMVDFAIACIRGLRNLKEAQERDELDTVTYLCIMRDIDNIVSEVSQKLLFIL